MNDEPRQKLRELILEHGRSLCTDPRRCEALLKDYCGTYKREIFVLVAALKNRVADDLLKSSASLPPAIVMGRLQQRLEDDLALAADAAHWAVESWALALGFITQSVPVVAKPAQAPLPKPAAVAAPAIPVVSPPDTAKILMAERYRDKVDADEEIYRQRSAAKRAARLAAVQALSVAPAILMAGRYRSNGDGTVTDVTTGLQWMRFSLGQEWRGGCCQGEAAQYQWQEAQDTAKELNLKGGYAGHLDWRLPSKDELLSLVYCSSGQPKIWNDTGRACEGGYETPTIVKQAFPNTPSLWFWSDSLNADYSDLASVVFFYDGYVGAYDQSNSGYVRLVRGGQ